MDRATADIYEREAAEWDRRRPARLLDDARAFAAVVPHGTVRLDLGCASGKYLDALGRPVVALDVAKAMLDLVSVRVPDAMRVQADLEHLPFRRAAAGAAWAIASYVHVPRQRLPLALAHLHWTLSVGAVAELLMFLGDYEGDQLPGDDFAGRFFAQWDLDDLCEVLHGAGFDLESHEVTDERVRLRLTRARTLPDTVGPGMRLLVCGLNPSLYAADAGVGYARPGNRFWPAALTAGLVSRDRDALHTLEAHGVGLTDLVKRATVSAAELTREEFRAGLTRVEGLVRWLQPAAVCFVGLSGWRSAVDKKAVAGPQPRGIGGVPVYVMPSTSGLNAHAKPADIVEHLRAAMALV